MYVPVVNIWTIATIAYPETYNYTGNDRWHENEVLLGASSGGKHQEELPVRYRYLLEVMEMYPPPE